METLEAKARRLQEQLDIARSDYDAQRLKVAQLEDKVEEWKSAAQTSAATAEAAIGRLQAQQKLLEEFEAITKKWQGSKPS